jgi:hypothetical protein
MAAPQRSFDTAGFLVGYVLRTASLSVLFYLRRRRAKGFSR